MKQCVKYSFVLHVFIRQLADVDDLQSYRSYYLAEKLTKQDFIAGERQTALSLCYGQFMTGVLIFFFFFMVLDSVALE